MSTTSTDSPALRFDWTDYQAIADQPQVYETIRALLDDHTEDNATSMVRQVVEAAAERLLKLTQAQPTQRGPLSPFDAAARAMDMASLLAGAVTPTLDDDSFTDPAIAACHLALWTRKDGAMTNAVQLLVRPNDVRIDESGAHPDEQFVMLTITREEVAAMLFELEQDIADCLHAAAMPRLDDFDQPIVYDTDEIDLIAHALTGDEGEDDGVTVLNHLVKYLGNVHPGKTMTQVLIETEEARAAAAPQAEPQPSYRPDFPKSEKMLGAENEKARQDERLYGVGFTVNGWHVPAPKVACWGMKRDGAPQAPSCTCPTGDGSLRWPCPAHPPKAEPVPQNQLEGIAYAEIGPNCTRSHLRLRMGFGRIEVGTAIHEGRPSLWFGKDGQGLGFERDRNEASKPDETLAVITFENLQGLEAIEANIPRIRALLTANPEMKPHENGGRS